MRQRVGMLVALVVCFVLLSGFRPFTPVTNVCPRCTTPPHFDTVVLIAGAKIACNVIAQNADYYVLERFGEQRMVKKSDVSSVEWKDKNPPKLGKGDQILLNSGMALHGTITDEQPKRLFTIQVGKRKHVIWVSQIQSVYKNGVVYAVQR